MVEYLLRAEGVNMDNFIFDTHDISTIRGGSFLMREAFTKNKEKWEGLKLSIVSLESNSGLFTFQAEDDQKPERIKKKVLSILDESCEHHSTFVVDYVKKSDDFNHDFQKLLAKNRWRQYNELSVKLPIDQADTYCELDGVSPASEKWPKPNETQIISKSAAFRRRNGIELRRQFAKKVLKMEGVDFTDDLKSLAEDPSQGNLNGKIAYIYLDGNRFGSIRGESCKNASDLINFQDKIQNEIRINALKRILEYAIQHKGFLTKDDKVRLEVLMWGGDEVELVVPAWQGWRTLTLFFNPELLNAEFGGYKLTHAAAVVFCHTNAPILHIRSLAKEKICEQYLKKENNVPKDIKKIDCQHNIIGITVLDSIDQLYQRKFDERLIISATKLKDIESNMRTLKRYFSHNKIYAIENLAESDINEAEKELERAIDLLPKNIRVIVKSAITSITNNKMKNWTIIADLWNLITKEERE